MTPFARVIYTARTHTTGGREHGASRSSDGRLDVRFAIPGSPRIGTNPEQLLAAGWSACFESALAVTARQRNMVLSAEMAIDAEVDLKVTDDALFLSARLYISLPGVDRDIAKSVIVEAREICPFFKAIHGNIDVAVNLV